MIDCKACGDLGYMSDPGAYCEGKYREMDCPFCVEKCVKHSWKLYCYEYKVPFLFFFTKNKRQDFHVCRKCDRFLFERGVPDEIMADCIVWYRKFHSETMKKS